MYLGCSVKRSTNWLSGHVLIVMCFDEITVLEGYRYDQNLRKKSIRCQMYAVMCAVAGVM